MDAITPNAKTLFTGKTHSKAGRDGFARSSDGFVDLKLSQPHPAAGGSYFLRARLNVTVPGLDHAVAEELAAAAHGICPYSKAVHGNIDVTTNVL